MKATIYKGPRRRSTVIDALVKVRPVLEDWPTLGRT